MNMKEYLSKRKELIEEYLKMVLPVQDEPQKLHEALWFSMFAGGKRIRAILMLAIADIAKSPIDKIISSAAGVEMVHTSTLILDDLPSMDDALLRRGKPALHRVYGEATAIIAANILMLEGIHLITNNLIDVVQDKDKLGAIISELFSEIGKDGIMLGQFLDLTLSNQKIKAKDVEDIHNRKTASLFKISAKIAAEICGLKTPEATALINYAVDFGLIFQISDDILAVEGVPSKTGKMSLASDRRPNYIDTI
ncbi:MAG: polyprenyl synthetase family protein, partial [Candidatus Omnitrophica bacterium]|nr:polyprenyl synthetase family protein [Candidatus Omnitrophota bacterium]